MKNTTIAQDKFNKAMMKNGIDSIVKGCTVMSPTPFGRKLIEAKSTELWNNTIAEFIKEHNDVIDPGHENEAHIALANILFQTVVEGHCTMSDVNNINIIKQGLGCALGAIMIACNR